MPVIAPVEDGFTVMTLRPPSVSPLHSHPPSGLGSWDWAFKPEQARRLT